MRKMTLGQIVDICIEHYNREKKAEAQRKREEKYGRKRKGTQADLDNYLKG